MVPLVGRIARRIEEAQSVRFRFYDLNTAVSFRVERIALRGNGDAKELLKLLAWSDVPILWPRKDERRVPEHWKRFGSRISPLSHSPRLAANPPNALLNFLYGILESEARLSAVAMGLDPAIGFLSRGYAQQGLPRLRPNGGLQAKRS